MARNNGARSQSRGPKGKSKGKQDGWHCTSDCCIDRRTGQGYWNFSNRANCKICGMEPQKLATNANTGGIRTNNQQTVSFPQIPTRTWLDVATDKETNMPAQTDNHTKEQEELRMELEELELVIRNKDRTKVSVMMREMMDKAECRIEIIKNRIGELKPTHQRLQAVQDRKHALLQQETKAEEELNRALTVVEQKREELTTIKTKKTQLLEEESKIVSALQETDQKMKDQQTVESFIKMATLKVGNTHGDAEQKVVTELLNATLAEFQQTGETKTMSMEPAQTPMDTEPEDPPFTEVPNKPSKRARSASATNRTGTQPTEEGQTTMNAKTEHGAGHSN